MFQLTQNRKRVKLSLGMVAILGLLVVGVLGLSTETFNAQIAGTNTATEVVNDWLEETEMTAISVTVSSSEVVVVVTGPDEPPPVEELASSLEEGLGEPVDVKVNWIPRTTYELTTAD